MREDKSVEKIEIALGEIVDIPDLNKSAKRVRYQVTMKIRSTALEVLVDTGEGRSMTGPLYEEVVGEADVELKASDIR